MKNIAKTIVAIGFLVTLFVSCSSSDKAEFTLKGNWKVYIRHFECKENTALETQVNNLLTSYMEAGRFEYILDEPSYKERYYEGESTTPTTGLEGTCSPNVELKTLDVLIRNIPNRGTWEFTASIGDLNTEMFMLKHEMDDDDIEKMLLGYFNINRIVPAGTVATMVTKAERIRE